MNGISVGQKVRFNPFATIKDSIEQIKISTVGTVAYVNEQHGWFSVQYGGKLRTSFKFCEIGQAVHIIG